MLPFGIQPIHLIVIVVVALIIFGPRKLPEIGRGLGKALNEFRQGAKEMTEGFTEEVRRPDAPAETAAAAAPPVTAAHAVTAAPAVIGATAVTAGPAQSQPVPQPAVAAPAATTAPAPAPAPAPATVVCPNCHAANPSGAAFCNQCGTKLAY
jgi:TatA/E family protein of Tat protein translocase